MGPQLALVAEDEVARVFLLDDLETDGTVLILFVEVGAAGAEQFLLVDEGAGDEVVVVHLALAGVAPGTLLAVPLFLRHLVLFQILEFLNTGVYQTVHVEGPVTGVADQQFILVVGLVALHADLAFVAEVVETGHQLFVEGGVATLAME